MIDIPTVFILISVLSLTLGGAIRITQTTVLKWGLQEFSYALIAHGVAYGLFTLSPRLGNGTIWVAEISVALFFSFTIQAFEVFFGRTKRWTFHVLLIGSIALFATLFFDHRPARIMCGSLVLILAEAAVLKRLWARRRTTPGNGQYLVLAAFVLSLITLFYRELTTLMSFTASGAVSISDLAQALLYTATLVGLTLLTVGFLLMAKERTEHLNQQMILSDKLTGIWNRRKLEEVAEGEIHRLNRHGTLVSLLIIDLDDFKVINDTFGHAAGDAVLQAVTSSWRTILKDTDVLGRWGGEEFAVILPGTGVDDALLVAERLRDVTSKTNIGFSQHITISIGASFCLSGDSWQSWFDRADAALYRAKTAGKNRVSHDIPILWEDGTSLIRWSPLFETTIPELDADHRRLVEMANHLLHEVQKSGDKTALNQALSEIELDMRQHFAREETVLAKTNPDDLQNHRSEHTALLTRLHFLTNRFQRDSLPLEALVQFMAFEMCAHHMGGSDRLLFKKSSRP